MVALNFISSEMKRQHLENMLVETEKLVISAAIQAGVNPNEINVSLHPTVKDVDPDDIDAVLLAERVAAYKLVSTQLKAL